MFQGQASSPRQTRVIRWGLWGGPEVTPSESRTRCGSVARTIREETDRQILQDIAFHSGAHQEAFDAELYAILQGTRHKRYTTLADWQAAVGQVQDDGPGRNGAPLSGLSAGPEH